MGASVVNALSEWLIVQVHKDGRIYEMRFSRGNITQEMKIIGETDRTGTTVTFKPDPEMFDDTVYSYDILHTRMRQEAFLNAGLRMHTIDLREGQEQEDEMCYEGGIREYVTYLNKSKDALHQKVIYMSGMRKESFAEIAMQYNDGYQENIISFANDVNTPEGGMHETGFRAALTRVLNNYGIKNGIIKGDDKVSGEDCREGLTAVISVKLPDAQFEGQTKQKLGNSEMRTLVDNVVSDKLAQFLEENPVVARTILDKAMMANRAREAARKARESIRRKSALGGAAMPDKLRDCNENNPELTTAPAAPPRTAATPVSRQYCRCGERCSTWRRSARTRSTATTSSSPSSSPWARDWARSSTSTSFAITRSSSWRMPMWTAAISAPCC